MPARATCTHGAGSGAGSDTKRLTLRWRSSDQYPLSHLYLLFSLLCANESRLSTAGRALPSHSLSSYRSPPRWQSLARPWKTAYSTKGGALASGRACRCVLKERRVMSNGAIVKVSPSACIEDQVTLQFRHSRCQLEACVGRSAALLAARVTRPCSSGRTGKLPFCAPAAGRRRVSSAPLISPTGLLPCLVRPSAATAPLPA